MKATGTSDATVLNTFTGDQWDAMLHAVEQVESGGRSGDSGGGQTLDPHAEDLPSDVARFISGHPYVLQ